MSEPRFGGDIWAEAAEVLAQDGPAAAIMHLVVKGFALRVAVEIIKKLMDG